MRVLGYSHSVACSNAAKYRATSEWDTGAGDAIVRYAGGNVLTDKKQIITYNLRESFLNPNFIASNTQDHIDMFLDYNN